MNVDIGAEAALFPEKKYISGIFVAVFVDPCTHGRLDAVLLTCLSRWHGLSLYTETLLFLACAVMEMAHCSIALWGEGVEMLTRTKN
jgi:hypothetical protein